MTKYTQDQLQLSCHRGTGPPSGLLSSGFPTKTLYACPFCTICIKFPTHLKFILLYWKLGSQVLPRSWSLSTTLHGVNPPPSHKVILIFLYVTSYILFIIVIHIKIWAGIAQSIQRLATGWTVQVSNPGRGARFSAPVQTGPGATQSPYTMGTGSFPGVKRLGRGVFHPPHLA